ncbi:oxidoreductase, FAD-binding [Pseudooceanicola batsensis HTCC2597]|uniref:Oxidoreductase, FAD-binding n=1 Tax=Pseudooceanicola batsensis (strain ATCC BAA-863 / DSM 15984 / KCTC 12145 / HTCC2597) TaxID=252305 RepID=A3TZ61_PSEBH|nr:FAD-binding oxidoreductase [Pseudooceanicola batsensis]EAQ02879.1 oxidoreductase, FAD-binding [Pseudooceanicola batsensis HTCC2597]
MTLNPADDTLAARLRDRLDRRAFRDLAPRYLEEPRGTWVGRAGLVVAPSDVEEVSAVMAAAHAARVPVVPYGGGTGLVGGQVVPEGPAPLILSLERMTAIRKVDPVENVAVVEAGAVLEDVHRAAEAAGRLFPLSLAAKGSARIGGNLATNAGGVNVLRYGNARDLCLGLEAVLPDGRIWNGLTRLRKDNTGYDLRNLLVGSEGTLAVITAAALKLFARPAGQGTALAVVPDPRAALDLLALARDHVSEAISAFELMGGEGLRFLEETQPEIRRPFDPAPDWMVLIDLGLPAGIDPDTVFETIFAEALERGLVSDALIAQSAAQADAFWEVRERVPEANRLIGSVSSHDISLPLSNLPEFIDRASETVAGMGPFRINCFGHLGDGNLHYNVFPPKGAPAADWRGQAGEVKRAVHDLVHELEGSVSAEHGIGRLKTEDLERYGDPVKLEMMRAIKAALDPQGIMNPGAVLRG